MAGVVVVAELATVVAAAADAAWPDGKLLPSHNPVVHGDGEHSLEAPHPHHNLAQMCNLSFQNKQKIYHKQ